MQRITRDQAMKYEFDYRHEPLLRVEQGEAFVVETEDAGSGQVRSADVAPYIMDFPTREFEPPKGNPIGGRKNTPTGDGVWCSFDLTNTGSYVEGGEHPDDASEYLGSDIYRLDAEVSGEGWKVEIPNAIVAAGFGKTVSANVAVGAAEDAEDEGVVTLTATSESDPSVKGTAKCVVPKA